MIIRLTKALYGCVESARLWYNHLSTTLTNEGFIPNPIDPCLFNKTVDGVQITICVHVDDLLVASKDQSPIDSVILKMKEIYKDVKITTGEVHQYLGMVFDFSEKGKCRVTMLLNPR